MIALHVDPRTPVGSIAMKDHEFTAGCDTFQCEILGTGGHSARPHLTSDTAGAMGRWITTIYDRVPRSSDSRDSVVVSGRRFIVAPDVQVSIRGSYGAFSMLQKGMKVSVIFRQTVDGRFALEIHQLPDNQQIPQV